jgi:hypothetical protein
MGIRAMEAWNMGQYFGIESDEYWDAPGRWKILQSGRVPGVKPTVFPLGDPEAEDVPVVYILKMDPGFVLTRHAHDCHRVELVLQGSLDVGERTLSPGDVMVSAAWEFYGPHIAGPDGCVTAEVFATGAAAYRLIYEDLEGSPYVWDVLANGGARPDIGSVGGMDLPLIAAKVAAARASLDD